jgi:hypothetical protein
MQITFAPEGRLIEFTPRIKYMQEVSLKNFVVGGGSYSFAVNRGVSGGGGLRGEVNGFSRRSRSRMNKKMNMLKKHCLPSFITLTYGESYPTDFEVYKRDLDNFYKAIFYKYPEISSIWKLEFQERGAAHFHLLVWGLPVDLQSVLSYVVHTWHRIAGAGQEDHRLFHMGLLAGSRPCVEKIKSFNGVIYYASKYLAKVQEVEGHTGRIWGVRGKLPYSSLITFRVSLDEALAFRHALMVEKNYIFQRLGFWCTDYSVDWLLFLNEIMDYYSLARCPDLPPDWEILECLFPDVEVIQ